MEWTEEHDNRLCQEILVFEQKQEAFLEARSAKKLQTIWTALSSLIHLRSESVLLESDIYCWARKLK